MTVVLLPSALKELRALPVNVQRQIGGKIDFLAKNPFPAGHKALKGVVWFRVRAGDHRILYSVGKENQVVTVVRIRHRKDAYGNL